MNQKNSTEHLIIPITMDVPYKWSAGHFLGRFFRELRDNARLVANKCPKCGRILFPPRIVCGRCHVRAAEDWVELGPKGTVYDYTKVYYPMTDSSTGKPRPEPYIHGTIELDGGGLIQHYLEEPDIEKVKVGMRVEAVFKPREERKGSPLDIRYFRTIEE